MGVLVYFVTMALGMIVCKILGLEPDITQPIPREMWITSSVLSFFLSIGATFWYFQNKKVKPNVQSGLAFGAMVVLVGFLLDFLFFLSLSFDGYNPFAVMAMYYREPLFWTTLILILLGSSGVGMWLEKRNHS